MNRPVSSIPGLVRQMAFRFPDKVAIRDCDREYSYKELVHEIEQVSGWLVGQGTIAEDRVAILTNKSAETIICFLGIMEAGAIPFLLDSKDNKHGILTKCQTMNVNAVLIFDESQAQLKESFHTIDRRERYESTYDIKTPYSPVYADVCYMITTSGTTGVPKGISVTHENVLHYADSCLSLVENVPLNCGHVTSFSTDLGHTNWIIAFASGGTLRIFSDEESKDPRQFMKVVEKEKINFLKTTFSHFDAAASLLLKKQTDTVLDYLFLGGEKLKRSFVDKLYKAGICKHIFNHYGPSETTIGALVYKIPRNEIVEYQSESVPIGSGLGANKVFLVNAINDVGELCIEGPGVSLGYYNNSENKNFYVNPETGQRGYITGDICREVKPGLFEFYRRKDRQVKINGYRVELGEIESLLNKLEYVEDIKLNAFEDEGQMTLEAYIKPTDIATFNEELFQTDMREMLPYYKIPAHLYIREFCLYGRNGKIDFTKMRHRKNFTESKSFDAWDSWQESVRHCWSVLLNRRRINETDNFFDLGGNSLTAMRLIARLQINGYDVGISDINENPVFINFVKLNRARTVKQSVFEKTKVSIEKTISQRIFFSRKWKNSNKYIQSVLMETESDMDVVALAETFTRLRSKHFELSQSYAKNGMYSFSNPNTADVLSLHTLVKERPVSDQLFQITTTLNGQIDLSKGELFKSALIYDRSSSKKFLYLSCHHLATDILSWDIMLNEIVVLYDGIISQKDELNGSSEQLRNEFFRITKINKPYDTPPGLYEEIYHLPLEKKETGRGTGNLILNATIDRYSYSADQDRNALFLNCFSNAIIECFDLEKISVDLEFHGRPQDSGVDLNRSVSWWSVSLPITCYKGQTPKSLSEEVSRLASYANNLNSHAGEVLPTIGKSDIRFNFLGELEENYSGQAIDLQISTLPSGSTRDDDSEKEYLIFFTCRIVGDTLVIDIQYDRSSFDEATIYALVTGIKNQLENNHSERMSVSHIKDTCLFPSNISTLGKSFLKPRSFQNSFNEVKNVLLTGVTGFLGMYVLKELLLNKVKVNCIVRGSSTIEVRNRVNQLWAEYFDDIDLSYFTSQLNVYTGDLSIPKLGLGKGVYEELLNEVDAVLNCAADVNLSKSFTELKQVNADLVDKLLHFVRNGKKKELHHMSTMAVCGMSHEQSLFSENSFDRGQEFVSNYERSKYEAEQKVRKAIDEGVAAVVYRVGHIAGDSVNGKFQKNTESNRIVQLVKGIISLGLVAQEFDEEISFSHVDLVAKMLVNVVLKKVITEKTCLHLESSHYISLQQLACVISNFHDHIAVVSNKEFDQSVNEQLLKNPDTDTILKMQFWMNRTRTNMRNVKFSNHYSNDLFASSGLIFPPLGESWLRLFLNELGLINDKTQIELGDQDDARHSPIVTNNYR